MKDFKIYTFLATVALIIYVIVEYNSPKPLDWRATYTKTDKIPLGAYILYNRLPDLFPHAHVTETQEPIYNVASKTRGQFTTYFLVNRSAGLTEVDFKKLQQFLEKGNDAFIASEYFGDYLNKILKIEVDYSYYAQDEINTITFVNKRLSSNHFRIDKNMKSPYFSEFDTTRATVLALDKNNNATYLKFSYGKGHLYLNAAPQLLGNYHLMQRQGAQYAAYALSYLNPNTQTLIWDEYYTLGRQENQSPMRVLFNNAPLRWAYYISLFTLIIFVLYQMKRRQRIIPVLQPLQNATLEFVTVVGQVYYEQHNNSNIAHKKITYLLEHLRSTYNLSTGVLDKSFTESLVHKTGFSATEATELTGMLNALHNATKVSDAELIKLNQLIEEFYAKSR